MDRIMGRGPFWLTKSRRADCPHLTAFISRISQRNCTNGEKLRPKIDCCGREIICEREMSYPNTVLVNESNISSSTFSYLKKPLEFSRAVFKCTKPDFPADYPNGTTCEMCIAAVLRPIIDRLEQ